jgi:hypothetical protein
LEFFRRSGTDDPEVRRALADRLGDDDQRVRRSAMEFFTRSGTDDPEVRRALADRLGDDDLEIRRFSIMFFMGLIPRSSEAQKCLDVFGSQEGILMFEESRPFSNWIGRAASNDRRLLENLLEKGRQIKHLNLGLALSSMLVEQEEARRKVEPLRLAAPGCAEPE